MQDIWYGDRRDRLKWAGLLWLSQEHNIGRIVQIPYYRRSKEFKIKSECSGSEGKKEVSEADGLSPVRDHFSDLNHIKKIGVSGLKIDVFPDAFDPKDRASYNESAIAYISKVASGKPKMVFLDPDTGIAPPSGCKDEHLSESDVREIWKSLYTTDWLVLYQHAARDGHWENKRRNAFIRACKNAERREVRTIRSQTIAGDVILLAVPKK